MSRLTHVQRDVLSRACGLHDGHPKTLRAVAGELGMELSEVTRIHQRAVTHLQDVVGADAARRMLELR